MKVNEAVIAVMDKVRAVGKDQRNAQQGFNFRGIDATVNALSPVMREVGLTVHPQLVSKDRGQAQTAKGAIMNTVDVVVDYTFTGPEGDSFTARTPGEAFDSGDKGTAKAMSVAFRTCLLQTFALPTQEADPDAEANEAQTVQRPSGPDWNSLFMQARGNRQRLEALRNQGRKAGLPEDFGMFSAIETELSNLPIEGNVQP